MTVPERLEALRKRMEEKKIDVYVVPTADFHQSEYVGEHFKARKFITGFSGSAGTAVITKTEARLWTDGRYFIQAAKQLEGSTVELMKMGEPGVPEMNAYIEEVLQAGETLGFDGRVVSVGEGQGYADIAAKKGAHVNYQEDLIDEIWSDRPAMSEEPAFDLDVKYAGETVADKLARIRKEMKDAGANTHVMTTLDDICWTLNIRGNDIDFFPMVLSYAIVTIDGVELYIDERKLDDALKAKLAADGVKLHPYNDIYEDVKKFTEDTVVMVDPGKLNYAIFNNIPENVKTIEQRNNYLRQIREFNKSDEMLEIWDEKLVDYACKIYEYRKEFMKKINEKIVNIHSEITEMSASDKLDEFRAEMGNFIRPSFEPISSFGEHGAIVHYTSSPETDVELKEGQLFLTDTGAGFYEGSTDVTRTYALGEVPQIMKDHFTLVAISNLQLGNAKFLEGSTGMVLDILARKPFWDRDLNFNHGTGHGVGYLLNIHEGPTGFRWKYRPGETEPLAEGMIITDEPGIYIEGSHGIRLENELLTKKGTLNEYGQFMYFEAITLIPMDLDAINPDIMTAEDKKLLNDYHARVYEVISPYLNDEEKAWLEKYTRAI